MKMGQTYLSAISLDAMKNKYVRFSFKWLLLADFCLSRLTEIDPKTDGAAYFLKLQPEPSTLTCLPL